MVALIIALLFQVFPPAPRAALENPAVAHPVPGKLQKDYDKLWQRFVKGQEDDKVMKDTEKLLKKTAAAVSLTILEAYIDLYARRTSAAESKFEKVLKTAPADKISLSYLAEFAFAREDYSRAHELYSRLLDADPSRADLEPKRQKALLRATQDLIMNASVAEQANRLAEAESFYLQALRMAPKEPSLHERVGALYAKQMKWSQSLEEFRKAEELGSLSGDADRHIAEVLVNLGRAEEAHTILDRLKKTGSGDEALETKVNELEDIGRWGSNLAVFRSIQATPALARSELALLFVRYFPQLADIRRTPQIITDSQDSTFFSEIQTIVGTGLLDLRPNRTFQPAAAVTRGEFASALARLMGHLGLSPTAAPPVPLSDVAPSNARYREIQLVLSSGLMTLDDSGNFNVNAVVKGDEAVRAVTRVLELSRGKFEI